MVGQQDEEVIMTVSDEEGEIKEEAKEEAESPWMVILDYLAAGVREIRSTGTSSPETEFHLAKRKS